MKTTTLLLTLIFCIIDCGITAASNGNVNNEAKLDLEFYTAGVAEFRPAIFGLSSADILAVHIKSYEDLIRSTAANETDIIVFPEGTLNNGFHMTFVPAPKDKVIPCLEEIQSSPQNYADFFIKLSCIARDVKKYLVINLTEKENCTSNRNDPRPCASHGLNVYNTNVVFDRNGSVISRYRKVNLYVEPSNTTYEPEYGIFETDFGVRFGHFICFDILFYTPAQELVTKYGIKDFIFTTFFASELPFLTGVQIQQSWAHGNNVNLLASGSSVPAIGATGSGIYNGNYGQLVSVMVGGTGERKLYVAKVPKNAKTQKAPMTSSPNYVPSTKTRQTGIQLMKDPQIHNYTSELLKFTNETKLQILHLCHLGFCCDLNITATYLEPPIDAKTYKYRFGVFNGRRTYVKKVWSNIKVCALYACTSEDPNSCGEIFAANETNVVMNIKFHSIDVSSRFEKYHSGELAIMPNSLDDQFYSLNSVDAEWSKTESSKYFDVSFKLKHTKQNLLTFGIYTNYFERSTGAVSGVAILTLICNLIFVFMAYY